jgi:predicted CoA-binding protein
VGVQVLEYSVQYNYRVIAVIELLRLKGNYSYRVNRLYGYYGYRVVTVSKIIAGI